MGERFQIVRSNGEIVEILDLVEERSATLKELPEDIRRYYVDGKLVQAEDVVHQMSIDPRDLPEENICGVGEHGIYVTVESAEELERYTADPSLIPAILHIEMPVHVVIVERPEDVNKVVAQIIDGAKKVEVEAEAMVKIEAKVEEGLRTMVATTPVEGTPAPVVARDVPAADASAVSDRGLDILGASICLGSPESTSSRSMRLSAVRAEESPEEVLFGYPDETLDEYYSYDLPLVEGAVEYLVITVDADPVGDLPVETEGATAGILVSSSSGVKAKLADGSIGNTEDVCKTIEGSPIITTVEMARSEESGHIGSVRTGSDKIVLASAPDISRLSETLYIGGDGPKHVNSNSNAGFSSDIFASGGFELPTGTFAEIVSNLLVGIAGVFAAAYSKSDPMGLNLAGYVNGVRESSNRVVAASLSTGADSNKKDDSGNNEQELPA